MSCRVTLIPGDGIGPEVALAMKQCVDATGVKIDWDEVVAGAPAIEQFGTPLPDDVIESIKQNKIAIKGPIETPVGKGFRSVNVQLRQSLDLFAAMRPSKYYEGTKAFNPATNLVVVRENTEDLYAGIEFEEGAEGTKKLITHMNQLQPKEIRKDSAISIKPISVFGSERIVRFAFEYALKTGRKKVTAVHKANIMKHSDGLFLHMARKVAKDYEGKVEFNDLIIDNCCMQLVQNPKQFDVLVLSNLYGDIVSDLCAGLVGGLGIAPGANFGEDIALFEPVHGSAPTIAGKGLANPTACILSAVLMLKHIDEMDAANRLEQAVADVIAEGKNVTADLKGEEQAASTSKMADAICQRISS